MSNLHFLGACQNFLTPPPNAHTQPRSHVREKKCEKKNVLSGQTYNPKWQKILTDSINVDIYVMRSVAQIAPARDTDACRADSAPGGQDAFCCFPIAWCFKRRWETETKSSWCRLCRLMLHACESVLLTVDSAMCHMVHTKDLIKTL